MGGGVPGGPGVFVGGAGPAIGKPAAEMWVDFQQSPHVMQQLFERDDIYETTTKDPHRMAVNGT